MPIVAMNTRGFSDRCMVCGLVNSYVWDHGSTKLRSGPYALGPNAVLKIRVDDDGPNLGHGLTYDVELTGADPNAISTQEVLEQLSNKLPMCSVEDDDGGILIVSKTAGPISCVEPLGGSAAEALIGYPVDPNWHWGVGRPCLGFTPAAGHVSAGLAVIMLRKCSCRALPHLLVSAGAPTEDPLTFAYWNSKVQN